MVAPGEVGPQGHDQNPSWSLIAEETPGAGVRENAVAMGAVAIAMVEAQASNSRGRQELVVPLSKETGVRSQTTRVVTRKARVGIARGDGVGAGKTYSSIYSVAPE